MRPTHIALSLTFLFLSACASHPPARGFDDGTVQRYSLQGTIIRIDQRRSVITIRHGPITDAAGKVWMPPMTMEFPVTAKTALDKVTLGQPIRATVHSRQSDLEYWVENIRADQTVAPPAEPKP